MHAQTNLPSSNLVILFADMVGSTALKYTHKKEYHNILNRYHLHLDRACVAQSQKWLGDGVLVFFDTRARFPEAYCEAFECAQHMMQLMDELNLKRLRAGGGDPWIRIRIGIAGGECFTTSVGEVIGSAVDLSSRLCGAADEDTILITRKAKDALKFDKIRIQKKTLALQGILKERTFFEVTPRRVSNMRAGDLCKRGLLDFSPRDDLGELNPRSLIENSIEKSIIIAAGRTLRSWSEIDSAMYETAFKKRVKFEMLINHPDALHVLPEKQLKEAKKDLPKSVDAFLQLCELASRLHKKDRRSYPKNLFRCSYTPFPILDGLCCAEISLPGKPNRSGKAVIATFEINTSPGVEKTTMVWTCRCKSSRRESNSCPAHGLKRRTHELFQKAIPLSEECLSW